MTQIYDSTRLVQILASDILPATAQATAEDVTGFLPLVGRKYSMQLMVVGRAVNRWLDPIGSSQLSNACQCWKHAHSRLLDKGSGECPMSWVTAQWGAPTCYNTRKSAFWRVIRAVVGRLNIANIDKAESDWPSYLVWSNLYKVAPAKGKNPNTNLRRAQLKGCIEILRYELELYQPRRVLFLTGHNWVGPFLEQDWEGNVLPGRQSFVEATGQIKCGLHAAICVVARHPQGKNETVWVDDVVAALG